MFGYLAIFIVFVIIAVAGLIYCIIKLRKIKSDLSEIQQIINRLDSQAGETDKLVLALGQIPEGNYQAFIADPEGFAKAHTSAELTSMLEKHKAEEVKECLVAAAEVRAKEREHASANGLNDNYYAKIYQAKALAFEQRAQRLIDDKDIFRK